MHVGFTSPAITKSHSKCLTPAIPFNTQRYVVFPSMLSVMDISSSFTRLTSMLSPICLDFFLPWHDRTDRIQVQDQFTILTNQAWNTIYLPYLQSHVPNDLSCMDLHKFCTAWLSAGNRYRSIDGNDPPAIMHDHLFFLNLIPIRSPVVSENYANSILSRFVKFVDLHRTNEIQAMDAQNQWNW